MPTLTVEDDELVVGLSGLERLAAFHFSSVRFPVASITDVVVESDVWKALRGIRAPGTGIPGVIAYGTRRYFGGRDRAPIRRSRRSSSAARSAAIDTSHRDV